ncbi:uncharacterized protein LOC134798953 [Cydia splendana]|uniref:uncharacterized protein LOC134798953 n=1 Tax=Cydia splendana TaxID=1100963 RepID=UPI00300D7C6B
MSVTNKYTAHPMARADVRSVFSELRSEKDLNSLHLNHLRLRILSKQYCSQERARLQETVDRFTECSAAYEQALKDINSLERALHDAHEQIYELQEAQHNAAAAHSQSLFQELVRPDSQLVTAPIENLVATTDLAYDTTTPSYLVLFNLDRGFSKVNNRQKRYLLFTSSTQYGIFATVSVPLHPDTTTSVAWFYEANYYNVANATYFEPLLGDVAWGRSEDKRSADGSNELLTRRLLYTSIEAMLEKNRFPGRACLLRAICEAATSQLTHNGVLGDLLHLALTFLNIFKIKLNTYDYLAVLNINIALNIYHSFTTFRPSTSLEETDVEDCFYEAEYRGILHDCAKYLRYCPISPLDYISVKTEQLFN